MFKKKKKLPEILFILHQQVFKLYPNFIILSGKKEICVDRIR